MAGRSVSLTRADREARSRIAAAAHGWEWEQLKEFLHDLAGLEPWSAHGGVIRMQGTLSSSVSSVTIQRLVGSQFEFVVFDVDGILGYNDYPTESATVGSWNHNGYERLYVLAQNINVGLTILDTRLAILGDRQRGQRISATVVQSGDTTRLVNLIPPYGDPASFMTPHVLPRGTRIEATMTWQVSSGAVVGTVTAGITLRGLFIRSRATGLPGFLRTRARAVTPKEAAAAVAGLERPDRRGGVESDRVSQAGECKPPPPATGWETMEI